MSLYLFFILFIYAFLFTFFFFFFFSSRRRHTRFDCDWSSDVCSSDLNTLDRPTPAFLTLSKCKYPPGFRRNHLKCAVAVWPCCWCLWWRALKPSSPTSSILFPR